MKKLWLLAAALAILDSILILWAMSYASAREPRPVQSLAPTINNNFYPPPVYYYVLPYTAKPRIIHIPDECWKPAFRADGSPILHEDGAQVRTYECR